MDYTVRTLTGLLLAGAFLLTGCGSSPSSAAGGAIVERSRVTEIVVRYELGAPPATDHGAPWGSQCVSFTRRNTLLLDREIGGRMRVVRIDPPVSPTVARVIALQMSQCPYVEWAEADVVPLTVP